MALETGNTLGPYEIISQLGAGGMGEVYLARDTRLDRNVAIKVLPSVLSSSAEFRERFEREAKAISSLNHPHICALYDVGSEDGVDYLVMEHLEGESLSDRLKKGPLPYETALARAIEITEALDHAHRQGIVHRDLKPGNMMLTPSGAKLLDFGLAKLAQTDSDVSPMSSLPTEAKSLTSRGAILGTFQYMAPEQLEGQSVDARSDIFALGAVIYEMMTGRKAFQGKSHASLITAIMSSQPEPVSTVQATSPALLDHVIQRCLANDPDERWQSAYDVVRELKWISEGKVEVRPRTTASGTGNFATKTMAAAVLASAILSGVAAWALLRPGPLELRPVTKFAITVPPTDRLRGNVDISPDGRTIAYVALRGSQRQLYRRSMGELGGIEIPGTERATSHAFSPDGEWLAFFSGGSLKKVSLRGGPAVTLCEGGSSGVHWTTPESIQFSNGASDIWQVSSAGGTPRPLIQGGEENARRSDPQRLPGGTGVLFTASSGGQHHIGVQSLSTDEQRILVEGSGPRYAASGHLLFFRSGSVWGAAFDVDALELRGEPVPLVENVAVNPNGFARYKLSPEGTLVYVPEQEGASRTIVWVDREGQLTPLVGDPRAFARPQLSPDGKQLAVGVESDGGSDIWIYDIERGTRVRLTTSGSAWFPSWSPDGKRVVFTSFESGQTHLYWRLADGSGDEELLSSEGAQFMFPMSWTPDGSSLSVAKFETTKSLDITSVSADGQPSDVLATSFREWNQDISPDGRWLAYQSNESGRDEAYVQSYPQGGGKRVVSTDGGRAPLWSPDGTELFYRNGDEMLTVPIELGETLGLGEPRILFEGAFELGTNGLHNYDVTADGERFVMIEADASSALRTIHVVLNFLDELERILPTKN